MQIAVKIMCQTLQKFNIEIKIYACLLLIIIIIQQEIQKRAPTIQVQFASSTANYKQYIQKRNLESVHER